MRAVSPLLKASIAVLVRRRPSSVSVSFFSMLRSPAATMASAGMARRAAASVAPSPEANAAPAASASVSERSVSRPAPDSTMAFWNSPRTAGIIIRRLTDTPPADSPNMVTFLASPPNAATLRFTHSSAAIWSISP